MPARARPASDARLRILYVEDDARLQRIVARMLEHERWQVELASDGRAGLIAARAESFDCLVVDRMLPELDGLTLIRTLRAERCSTPALMLTARGERSERVEGLDAGADDYLGKPFAFEELLARIRALVRRASASTDPTTIALDGLTIDLKSLEVDRGDKRVGLTMREFAVLKALAVNSGRVLTRNELLAMAWDGESNLLEDIVDLYVHYLRRKLDPAGTDASNSIIRTVRGVGYALRAG